MEPLSTSNMGHGTVENVVFDMGNVLMTFDGLLFARPEWALLDAGAISHDTMLRIAA